MAPTDIYLQGQADYDTLRANLQLSPTKRLELLRSWPVPQENAIDRAISYGIDVSLLQLALSWTPTERLEKLAALINTVRTLTLAGAREHGIRDNSQASR